MNKNNNKPNQTKSATFPGFHTPKGKRQRRRRQPTWPINRLPTVRRSNAAWSARLNSPTSVSTLMNEYSTYTKGNTTITTITN
jgi:hypothetical protein